MSARTSYYKSPSIQEVSGGGLSRYAAVCGYNGNASATKYLEFHNSNPSDASPFVTAEQGTLKAISVAVKVATTATFTVYKNAVSVATLILTAQDVNSSSGLSELFAVNDKLSVALTSGSARDILFTTFIEVAA